MFDAHTHIQDARLAPCLAGALAAARRAGVVGLCCCAVSPADWEAVAALQSGMPQLRPAPSARACPADRLADPLPQAATGTAAASLPAAPGQCPHPADRPLVLPAFGVHPWYADRLPADWAERLGTVLHAHPAAAVGECGLDGIRSDVPPERQRDILRSQLEAAAAHGRPVVLHGARAWGPLLETVRPFVGRVPALIAHSFGGSQEILRAWLAFGGFVSFSGTLCNPAATRVRAAAAATPIGSLLIETDCPDLFPQGGLPCPECPVPAAPAATGPNHPANLTVVLAALAALRATPADELAALTQAATTRAFSLGLPA